MKRFLSLVSLIIFGFANVSFSDDTIFTSHRGFVFKKIVLLENELPLTVWKTPTGESWSEDLGLFTNEGGQEESLLEGTDMDHLLTSSPALSACEKINATLPTLQDYRKLFKFFNVQDESSWHRMEDFDRADLETLFPNLHLLRYWTANVVRDQSARLLVGFDTYGDISRRTNQHSVRCIFK